MKIIKLFSILIAVLTVLLTFSACGENEGSSSWDTPLGYKERIEKGLELYTNEKYHYAIDYPNIFSTLEKSEDGFTANSDKASLHVWIEKGSDLESVYEELKTSFELADGYISDTAMKAVYTDAEVQTYKYKMVDSGYTYSFDFNYPDNDNSSYTAYCEDMINRFVIITPMSEVEGTEEFSDVSQSTPVIPEGDNIFGPVNSDIAALELARNTYAKDFTVKEDGEMCYINPENPNIKLVLEGSTDASYLVHLYEVSRDAEGKEHISTINWYMIAKKEGYSVMEPMFD